MRLGSSHDVDCAAYSALSQQGTSVLNQGVCIGCTGSVCSACCTEGSFVHVLSWC